MNRLAGLLAAIDLANASDPNMLDGRPRAQVEGERASAWLSELVPDPSDALRIAARAHHLRRWEIVRADFASGRAGYLRWRQANKQYQATQAAELTATHGYPLDVQARVATLLLRADLDSDTETQVLEDVACLVFLETQFESMVERLEDDHLVGVVAKTLKKMSPTAIEHVGAIELSEGAAAIVAQAG